jgi:uncharacterized YccA/Bax inhibitor family protein
MSKLFESSNPILGEETYQRAAQEAGYGRSVMTIDGAVNKSLILGAILLATAAVSWVMPNMVFLWGGLIGGLVCVIASSFKPQWSPVTAPLYAAFEGLFLGTISLAYGGMYNGIVFQAFTLTIGLLFLMLFLYKGGFIQVTDKLRSGILMATGAIGLVYLVSWILSLFHIQMPLLHSGGAVGIGISLFIVAIASLNLLLDFDNFEKGARYGAPKYMEWYSAMGLLVTLVWLYLEILRLLSKLSRD